MPWCPICKSEYREGITTCVDCKCELVDDLSLVSEKEDTLEVEEGFEIDPETLAYAMDDEILKELNEAAAELEDDEVEPYVRPEVYVNNEEKAEENKTSAYTLLSVGLIGLVGVILFITDVIPSNMNMSGKYMITGVMGTLFILFLVMGIVSLRNFKIFKKKACKENNLTSQIKSWCLENFNKDEIDKTLELTEITDEVKYFNRVKYLKENINKQFLNLEDSYLNRLIDEIYDDIFE